MTSRMGLKHSKGLRTTGEMKNKNKKTFRGYMYNLLIKVRFCL